MQRSKEFHDYIIEDVLGHIPGITSRAMFGGYGIYKDKKIFAIIAEGELYFKAHGPADVTFFKTEGSHPFEYAKKDGKRYSMSYWLVPDGVLEDREKLEMWLEKAIN
jgi:DNA transformation protein and related proteins